MDKTDKMLDKLQADLSLIFHKIRNYELLEEKLIKIKTLMEKEKIVSEGSGALSVAAVMFNKIPLKNKNIVCLFLITHD